MAFNTAPANTNTGNNIPDSKKAVGFVNIYIDAKDGSRRKLGAITLNKNDPDHVKLAEWLAGDNEAGDRGLILKSRVDFVYNSAVRTEAKGFDLPFDAPTTA